MKRFLPVFLAAALVGALTFADSIKTWSGHETLRYTDLNSTFSHVHTYMVGGGKQSLPHNLLVDSDVDSAAAVAHSKLARPGLVPKAWGSVTSATCNGGAANDTACTVDVSQQVTRVSSTGVAGLYRVHLSYLPANSTFRVMVTREYTDAFNDTVCSADTYAIGTTYANSASTAQFLIRCASITGPTPNNARFNFVVFDDNN